MTYALYDDVTDASADDDGASTSMTESPPLLHLLYTSMASLRTNVLLHPAGPVKKTRRGGCPGVVWRWRISRSDSYCSAFVLRIMETYSSRSMTPCRLRTAAHGVTVSFIKRSKRSLGRTSASTPSCSSSCCCCFETAVTAPFTSPSSDWSSSCSCRMRSISAQ